MKNVYQEMSLDCLSCVLEDWYEEEKKVVDKAIKKRSKMQKGMGDVKKINFADFSSNKTKNKWIDIQCISDEAAKRLAQDLQLHILTLDDYTTDDAHWEKHEMFDEYLFAVFKEDQEIKFAPSEKETYSSSKRVHFDTNSFYDYIEYTNMCFIIFSTFVVTLHKDPIRSLPKVISRMSSIKEIPQSPDWILYAFLDVFTDSLLDRARRLEKEHDILHTIVRLADPNNHDEYKQIFKTIDTTLQKIYAMTTVTSNRKTLVSGLVENTQEDKSFLSSKDTRIYLRSVQENLKLAILSLDISHQSLHLLRENLFSQISINMNKGANDSE